MQFIPKTKKADDRKKLIAGQTNLTALERWFIFSTSTGNRNHKLCAYSFALIDMGFGIDDITLKVKDLNLKLADPLDEAEIMTTIIKSASRRIHTRDKV
jgi:hypothetical protein